MGVSKTQIYLSMWDRPAKWPNMFNGWSRIYPNSAAIVTINPKGERICLHVPTNDPEQWIENPIYGFRIKKPKP